MLKLSTVLNIDQSEFKQYKIHFAIGDKSNNKTEPLIEFFDNTFKEWQESQNQRNFERNFIISLIYYKEGKWLFAGIYKNNGCVKRENKYYYKTELVDNQVDLVGRIIVEYKKKYRQSYVLGENYIDDMIVSEIFDKPAMIEDFPGYSKVNIDFDRLRLIIEKEIVTWKNALSIMKGVYLIVDKCTGKKYVGSATGENALWNRWSDYVKNGHGNNKGLIKVIKTHGYEYAQNFKFSILEIATVDDEILLREAFWKDVLLTIEYGYNEN